MSCFGGSTKRYLKGSVPLPEYIENAHNMVRQEMLNKDGLKIATYKFPCKKGVERKGIILAVHGISSHFAYDFLAFTKFATNGYDGADFFSPIYEGSWAEAFNVQGFDVVGIDLQSYGLSEGARGLRFYFESFDDLVHDLIQFRETITSENPGVPVITLGHSMGGCVVVRLLQSDKDFKYAGAITLAPMMSLEQVKKKPINKIMLPLSKIVSEKFPAVRVGDKTDHVNQNMRNHFNNNLLNEATKIRARVARECLDAVDTARANVQDIDCPLLVIHAKRDTLCDPQGSDFLYRNASSTDKRFELVPGKDLWHAIHHEPGNEDILKTITEWLDGHF